MGALVRPFRRRRSYLRENLNKLRRAFQGLYDSSTLNSLKRESFGRNDSLQINDTHKVYSSFADFSKEMASMFVRQYDHILEVFVRNV